MPAEQVQQPKGTGSNSFSCHDQTRSGTAMDLEDRVATQNKAKKKKKGSPGTSFDLTMNQDWIN